MFYTPFSQHHRDPEDPDSHAGCMCINDWGRGLFVPTDDRVDADVLVGFNHKEPDPSKINLIWTHEPSVNLSFQPVQYQNGVPIYVFNLYCMNIYKTTAYYFIPKAFHPIEYVGVADVAHKFHNKRILMCSSYFPSGSPTEYSLLSLRQELAVHGHQLGTLDIIGREWPNGLAIEESRHPQLSMRTMRKTKLLRAQYAFNLAFENTNYQYYVSEKIWDAIKGYALPIYYGNDWIYEDFPKDSFVDYAQFNDIPSLFEYLDHLTIDKYVERLNRCIEVYNHYARNPQYFGMTRRKIGDDLLRELTFLVEKRNAQRQILTNQFYELASSLYPKV